MNKKKQLPWSCEWNTCGGRWRVRASVAHEPQQTKSFCHWNVKPLIDRIILWPATVIFHATDIIPLNCKPKTRASKKKEEKNRKIKTTHHWNNYLFCTVRIRHLCGISLWMDTAESKTVTTSEIVGQLCLIASRKTTLINSLYERLCYFFFLANVRRFFNSIESARSEPIAKQQRTSHIWYWLYERTSPRTRRTISMAITFMQQLQLRKAPIQLPFGQFWADWCAGGRK